MKKFELTTEFKISLGVKLFRIRALVDFGYIKAGELGGWIESENNLSQSGNAWVSGDARVFGNAEVSGDAWVFGDAEVSGNADYAIAQGFESEFRATTFFRLKGGNVGVKCGSFYGTLDEFREKVKETHGETKRAKEYLMLADLMEYRFSKER